MAPGEPPPFRSTGSSTLVLEWEGLATGPLEQQTLGLSPSFLWSPGSLVASAQQPGPRPRRGQVPEGKDWKVRLWGQGSSWEGALRDT